LVELLKQVRHTVATHGLLAPGDGVVVGVSGGPDSLCLLHVLLRLRDEFDLRLHVAHLHHGARGDDADADAEFVRSLAAQWQLPVTVERVDVPALARQHGLAFEEAARRVRYAFLWRVARKTGCRKIAVGHNADDQAETVLMHFLRGAGPAGLRGMLPATPIHDYRLLEPFLEERRGNAAPDRHAAPPSCTIIRPLLETPRAEIEAYCAAQGLAPRFDRSNLDTTYFRNRLRHELLPLLEAASPNLRARLCHTAAVVAADYEVLAHLRDQAWAKVVLEERETAVVLDRAAWRDLPTALQRAILRKAAYRLRRSLRDVSFVHVEHARRVARTGDTGAQATLPMGLALVVGYDALVVGDAGSAVPPPDEPLLWSPDPLPVQVPGTTLLPRSNWALQATFLDVWDAGQVTSNTDPWTAYFDAARLAQPIVLRPRSPGDRFCPLGMQHHIVKLSAFLINRKVPRAWRDRVPLLVAGGEIVWLCGHRQAEAGAVGPATRRVLQMRFERAP